MAGIKKKKGRFFWVIKTRMEVNIHARLLSVAFNADRFPTAESVMAKIKDLHLVAKEIVKEDAGNRWIVIVGYKHVFSEHKVLTSNGVEYDLVMFHERYSTTKGVDAMGTDPVSIIICNKGQCHTDTDIIEFLNEMQFRIHSFRCDPSNREAMIVEVSKTRTENVEVEDGVTYRLDIANH